MAIGENDGLWFARSCETVPFFTRSPLVDGQKKYFPPSGGNGGGKVLFTKGFMMSMYTKEQMPSVARLFDSLAAGEMPNFLELLSALSNIGEASVLDDSDAQDARKSILRGTPTPQYPVLQPGASCPNCG